MATMPNQRNLSLTKEQEAKLVTYIEKTLPELEQDNKGRIQADKRSDEAYENSRAARAQPDTIYAESNFSVPITSTVVDHFSSRTEEEIYGRSPMVNFGPEGPADQELVRGLDRFSQYKLFKQAKVRESLLDANHSAFRHRALILKAIYSEDIDEWEESNVSVLHSKADEQPVIILDHGYVIEGVDKFMDVVDPLTQQSVQVLEKDPTLVLDQEKYYYAPSKKPIRFKDVNYSGPKSVEVDSDCFYARNSVRSLNDSDALVEVYDKPKHWIRDRFIDRPWMKWENFRTLVIGGASGSRKTKDERQKLAKDAQAFDLDNPSFGIAEIWLDRDVLDWGTPQRIVAWYERKTKTLIDYEFQKKITPHGRHPYSAIAVSKHKNYWWGPSMPEMVEQFQEYVDKQWNRHSYRNSMNANPIIAENPEAIQEKRPYKELKPGDVFTLESNKSVQDWLQAFVIPNADLDTQDLVAKAIEFLYFWLGISNIARGDYSDVPQNTTLGGQEASLKEASKLSRRWTRRMAYGLEDHFTKLVQIVLATMNPEEVYTYLEGDVQQMGFITEDSVRDFLVNAKLNITKDNSTQKLQEQQLTLQTITQYVTYPPQVQAIVRPVMKQILYLLGHDDVEQLLPVPMMPVIDPMTGQTVMAPASTTPPPQNPAAPAENNQVPPEDPAAAPAAAPAGGPENGAVVPFPTAANG